MGGYGSGKRWSSNSTTEDYRSLDVRWLQREGLLREGLTRTISWSSRGEVTGRIEVRMANSELIFSYSHRAHGEEWEGLSYPVGVEWTPCDYGGQRAWFDCPASGCGRRVAILYSGRIFACRHCYRLAYECQREASHYRLLRKAQKLSVRLGGHGFVLDGVWRPKGMHQRTFERLQRRFEEASSMSNRLAIVQFGL